MERTVISWNVMNLITVPLMSFIMFLLAALLWQWALRSNLIGQAPEAASTAGGY